MYKFWFIVMLALFTGKSIACSCAGYDIEERYNKYPSVFVGTVEKVEVIKRREPGSWFSYIELMQVTLKLDKLYKGSPAKNMVVMTRPGYGACGFPFKLNQQYAVFAYQDNKDLAVSSCSPTIHTEKGAQHYEEERLTVLNFLALQNDR